MIGTLLIVLDVGFMISSIFAILISLWMLRRNIRAINKKSREESKSVKITPEPSAALSSEGPSVGDNAQMVKSWGNGIT